MTTNLLVDSPNVQMDAKDIAKLQEHISSGSDIISVSIPVSSAELNALFTTPKVLVAAPGANLIVMPVAITFVYLFGTVAYSNIGSVGVFFTDANGPDFGQNVGGTFTTTSSKLFQAPVNLNGNDPLSACVNKPLVFADYQDWASAGNGTAIINVVYSIVVSS